MSKSDSLHDLRREIIDEDGYLIDFFDDFEFIPVDLFCDLSVLYYDKNIIFKDEIYPLGTFSEKAMNVFMDYKMFHILESLKYIHKIYKQSEFIQKSELKIIEHHLAKINVVYMDLLIYEDDIKRSLKLEELYDYFVEELNDEDEFNLYLSKILFSYLEIADTIADFMNVYYYFSKDYITEQSEYYDNNFVYAYEDYFNEPVSLEYMGSLLKFLDVPFEAVISSKSWLESYKTLDNKENIIVESISFDNYASFLQYDYLKALQAGYTLRTCKNCERLFLQTTKYHTSYCDRIYKNTNKTCRKIGPKMHHKEKVDRSPIHGLALTSYNRIAQRYYRETITSDEYNDAIALINEYKDEALAGQLDIMKFKKLLEDI